MAFSLDTEKKEDKSPEQAAASRGRWLLWVGAAGLAGLIAYVGLAAPRNIEGYLRPFFYGG